MNRIASVQRLWDFNRDNLREMGTSRLLLSLADFLDVDATFQDLIELDDDPAFWDEWERDITGIEEWASRFRPYVGREEDLPDDCTITVRGTDNLCVAFVEDDHRLVAARRLGMRYLRVRAIYTEQHRSP